MWPDLLQLAKDTDDSVAFDAFRGLDDHAGPGDVAELMALAHEDVSKGQRKRLLTLANRIELRQR